MNAIEKIIEKIKEYFPKKIGELQGIINKYSEQNNAFQKGIEKSSYKLVDMQKKIKIFQSAEKDLRERGETLRVGIVGQVKAGKSSFINALLFDGNDILPKAATPMTAALTVVKYHEKLRAEVEFYSEEDWEILIKENQDYRQKKQKQENDRKNNLEIESLAQHPGKAASELIEMAEKNNLDTANYLGKTQTIDGVSKTSDLNKKLLEYVGANGKYTPIVKSSTLYLNIEMLKGIELVDTPGMNDPIISRGEATLNFLSHCDIVFILSYAGQFMDQTDLNFFSEVIPGQGISHIILVGSKIDTIFLQDNPKSYDKDLKKASIGAKNKLEQAAQRSLKTAVQGGHPTAQQLLDKSLPPKLTSAILHSIAQKRQRGEQLDENQRHILNQLEKKFPKSKDLLNNDNILREIAGIDRLRNKEFESIRANKKSYLQDKRRNMASAKVNELQAIYQELIQSLKTTLSQLEGDPSKLNDKVLVLENKMTHLESNANVVFREKIINIQQKIRDAKNEATGEVANAQADIEIRNESYRTGWWIFKTTHHRNVKYIHAAQVINDLKNTIHSFTKNINSDLDKIFNKDALNDLGMQLAVAIKDDVLDDVNSDVKVLIEAIHSIILENINISDISINIDSMRKEIIKQFGRETQNINTFQEKFDELKDFCQGEIKKQLSDYGKNTVDIFKKRQQSFIGDLIDKIKDEADNLIQMQKNGNKCIEMFGEIIKIATA